MPNPPHDARGTKPGSAGWYEPDGNYHPFNVDLEPDNEYAARVKDAGLLAAGAAWVLSIAASISNAAALVRAGVDRASDLSGAVRSELAGIRREGPAAGKAILHRSYTDTVLAAGAGASVTPIIDVRRYRYVGIFVANIGAAAVTTTGIEYGYDIASVPAYQLAAAGPAAGLTVFYARGGLGASTWDAAPALPCATIRLYLVSAAGTTVRTYIYGAK